MNFYTSLVKGLKLKVRKFCRLIPTFLKVTEEKLVGGLSPILNRVLKPASYPLSRERVKEVKRTQCFENSTDVLFFIVNKEKDKRPAHVLLTKQVCFEKCAAVCFLYFTLKKGKGKSSYSHFVLLTEQIYCVYNQIQTDCRSFQKGP